MATSSEALGPTREVDLPEGRIRYHERGTGPMHHPRLAARGARTSDARRHRLLPVRPRRSREPHPYSTRLEEVTLVGNDTGGAICQAVAALHPERLARLVLTPCDAFDDFLPFPIKHLQLFGRSAAGLKVLAESLRFRWIQRLPIAFGLLTRRPIPADIMASYTGPLRVNRGTRRDFARLVRAISVRYTQEAATGLTDFDRPVLLAWAQQNFFPVDHAERLAKLLPNVQLRVIDDSGPFVAEDQPRHLIQLLDQFLAQRASDSR